MTYSNARIVRGNDFKLQITVEAPRDYVNEQTLWDDFDLTSCSEIHVALICEKDQIVIPLEWEIEAGTTNVLICPVKGNYLHSGAAYGVEVKGVDKSGYAWRWKAKGKEMFSIVDNTSAQNLDANLTPEVFDINARVGFEIHVDLSDYYTKEEVDASQETQDDAIAALDDKVDANEADIEEKIASEITRATAAEGSLQTQIDDLEASAGGDISALSQRITDEVNRATAADQANANAIANEVRRAEAEETDIYNEIERITRIYGNSIDRIIDGLDNEITRATAAEQTNANAISAEVTRAQGAESTLQDNIDAEETRAKAAEQANTNAIAAEVTRATGVEETNATAISNEVTRAQGAEQDLQDQIDALEASAGGDISGLTQRIAAEETRAKAAEQAIDADVTALEAAMPLKANSADLATVATSGSYNDLSNKPTIPVVPTNVSAFTNDSGYLVAADITGKADKADTYTKTEVDEKIDDIIGGEINLQNYYTKAEVDASQAAQDTAIAAKAPQATTYTKTEVNNLLSPKANSADLATVATSGSYNDLSDKPDIPAMQVQSDWNQTGINEPDYIKNKPTIPVVPTNVSDFTNDAGYLVSSDIAGKADKSDTYTKDEVDQIIEEVEAGQGSSLSNYYTKTQIDSQQQVQDAAIANKANSADLATVATSGDYDDLINKPTIPAAQVQADWGQTGTGEIDYIKNKPTNVSDFTNDAGYLTEHQSLDNYYTKTEVDNKDSVLSNAILLRAPQATTYTKTEVDNLVSPKANSADLATVATSGSYNDLLNKPHIPNDQVQSDWTQTGTSEPDYIKNKPTNVSAFTNDAGYLTEHQSLDNYYTKAQVDEYENTQNLAILSKAPQSTTYTKTEVNNLVSPKANSADLATVATSGSYNDLLNKPTIPAPQVQSDWGQTGMTEPDYIKNKPTNVSAFTNDAGYLVSSDITGKADKATTYTKTEVDNLVSPKANSADLATVATSGSYNDLSDKPDIPAMQVQSDWAETGTAEPSYIQNKPTNVSAFTNDAGYLTEHQSLDNYYTKTESDAKYPVKYAKFILRTNGIIGGAGAELKNVNIDWENPVEIFYSGDPGGSYMGVCIKWPDAYDSVNDTNYIRINNPNAGDELVFGWTFIKEAATNSDMLIIDNNGTTLYSHHIEINDSTHLDAEYFTYTFEDDYDYIIICTNCDKPMYCTEFSYNAVSSDNNLSDVIATKEQIQGALDNKANTWDIVQSDWNQTGTSEPDYIKNKPNLATVATSGSYDDLSNKPSIPAAQVQADWGQTGTSEVDYIKNKPNLATVATSGSYNDLSNKPSIPDDSNLVHKTGAETIAGNKTFSNIVRIKGGKLSVLGSMNLNISQDKDTDKPGFTVYNTTNNECGALQFRPNTIDSKPLLYLGHYNSITALDQTYVGFRNYTGPRNNHGAASYNLVCPLPEVIYNNGTWGTGTVGGSNYYTFYMPLAFMNSSKSNTPVAAASDGTVDIANLLPTFATVATSGSYNDLSNKPTIPAAQVQADWGQTGTGEVDYIKNKPTNVSAFTNDAGYLTQHQSLDNCVQSTTTNLRIEVVSEMPVSPTNNTLYVVQ